eukprot:4193571-Amphidinium_carterae.1
MQDASEEPQGEDQAHGEADEEAVESAKHQATVTNLKRRLADTGVITVGTAPTYSSGASRGHSRLGCGWEFQPSQRTQEVVANVCHRHVETSPQANLQVDSRNCGGFNA